MSVSLSLSRQEHNTLLDYYRAHLDPAVRLRAHIILLLAQGRSWALITALLFTSSQTITRWQQRFATDRVEGLFGKQRGSPARTAARWSTRAITWVTERTPRALGLFRSRWSCATVGLLLWQEH